MSNAALLAEAIDAAITLARAYALWLLLLATIAATAWTVRGAWRGVTAALRAAQRRRASQVHRTPVRPSDGRTADHDYQEAA